MGKDHNNTIEAAVAFLARVDSRGSVTSNVDNPGSEPWFLVTIQGDEGECYAWIMNIITKDGLSYHKIDYDDGLIAHTSGSLRFLTTDMQHAVQEAIKNYVNLRCL